MKAMIGAKVEKLFKDGFVVIDFETTDFDSNPKVEVVEIAIINHQGEVLMDTLVKPEYGISAGAYGVHGISEEDCKDAPLFQDIYPQFAEVLKDQNVIAYNFTFEQNILKRITHRLDLPKLSVKAWHCAMRDYQAFKGRRSFTKLTSACHSEGITVDNAHRAMGDCIMTLALLKKMGEIK